jgi:membrane protein required for beta-lactamase induction
MNFLALLLGLAIERLVTHLFHLREFRWLDPLFDWVLARCYARSRPTAMLLLGLLTVLLVAPVAALAWLLWDEFLQIPYFAFAVVLLLFALGPRDLEDEVDEYAAALVAGDADAQRRLAKELAEQEPPTSAGAQTELVERAIFIQANNRVFGVVFWFLVAGPTGAWLFRVLDLLRRRMTYRRASAVDAAPLDALWSLTRDLHGLVAWIPARLLAAGYALAGDFEEAVDGWRNSGTGSLPLAEGTETILGRVGARAAARSELDAALTSEASQRISAARALVIRTLWMIWCPIIAVMTLYNWVA